MNRTPTAPGNVSDTSPAYSPSQTSLPYLKSFSSLKVARVVRSPLSSGLPGNGDNSLASLCTISTSNTLPIPAAAVQSLLIDTPSYCALKNSNSIASFPERSQDDEDVWTNQLDYLLWRSAQISKYRRDSDLFQQKRGSKDKSGIAANDDSCGSDSSSQAEYGSHGSLSDISHINAVFKTYYSPTKTLASLVTLPSLHKVDPLPEPMSTHESWPTIPSVSSQSLRSIVEACDMIWKLEEIATELKAIDNDSAPNLSHIPSSFSSLPPSPKPDIPLPPLPSYTLLFTPSITSIASPRLPGPVGSIACSLAYLRNESAISLGKQNEHSSVQDLSLPRIVVTEPSSEDLSNGEVLVKDSTLLMDLVEDCYGDHWDPRDTLLYRTQTATYFPSTPSSSDDPPPDNSTPPSQLFPRRITFSETPVYRLYPKRPRLRKAGKSKAFPRVNMSSCVQRLLPRIGSFLSRCFIRSPKVSQSKRQRPKNVREKPISYPTPIDYRKSWPACAVDPTLVRKSMGESQGKLRKGARHQRPLVVQLGKPPQGVSVWGKLRKFLTRE